MTDDRFADPHPPQRDCACRDCDGFFSGNPIAASDGAYYAHAAAAVPADVAGMVDLLDQAKDAFQAAMREDTPREDIRRHVEAVNGLARLAAQGQRQGWQPIETAPEGPALMLFADDEVVHVKGNAAGHIRWLKESGYQQKSLKFRATGWMPLPAAPTQEADDHE